jgi:glycosyltransferase involved in cell wall biosynthesis
MSDTATVSVVLPIHVGADAGAFRAAVDSILGQTRPADEVVIVEDGPLLSEHEEVLGWAETSHPAVVRVRLVKNQGAGVANQAGLLAASCDWIVKADADDISVAHRIEYQLDEMRRTGADVCGSAMLEFEGEAGNVTTLRSSPENHPAIARRMRFNSSINHPTAMYRREIAIAVGGYPDMRFMQDYVLFARMLRCGATMVNISEALVYFRAGDELHRRRSARAILGLEWRLQKELRNTGLIRWPRSLANFAVRCAYRLLPLHLMRWVHRNVLASGRPGRIVT